LLLLLLLPLLLLLLQVENGKGAMPAWSGTLDDDEIAAGETASLLCY
jgi:mono/diheme cytochrome c family protein